MKLYLQNAVCGVLDYAAYPLGMIAIAPVLLRGLGTTQFGIWAFTMAGINTGAILASGFGDANIQQIAVARRMGDTDRIENCIQTTLSIHLVLGSMLAFAGFAVAPVAARHIVATDPDLRLCILSLRIGSFCILLRALETVVVSTQRAFERYTESIRISATVRVLSLGIAGLLALHGSGVLPILLVSALLLALGTAAQFVRLCSLVSSRCFVPEYRHAVGEDLLRLGTFTWLQAAAGAAFGQVDRLVVGMAFGAVAVACYSICMQIAQPIAGTAASAFHFVFPLLARSSTGRGTRITRSIAIAFACNLLLVTAVSSALLAIGGYLLRTWTTPEVAKAGITILPAAILASAFAGLAVTGVYAMLALGRAVAVVATTTLAGTAMLASIGLSIHQIGVLGVAYSRVLFGVISLAIYIPLLRVLQRQRLTRQAATTLGLSGVGDGV